MREVAAPCIVVDDPVTALGRIASRVREQLHCRVVAITGSSGKTSTKDLVASVLAGLGLLIAGVATTIIAIGVLGFVVMLVGSVIVSSDADGIHFDPDQHERLGKAMAAKVRELIG